PSGPPRQQRSGERRGHRREEEVGQHGDPFRSPLAHPPFLHVAPSPGLRRECLLKMPSGRYRRPLSPPPAIPRPESSTSVRGASSTLRNAQSLARLLDTSLRVPGTRIRIGLDPLIGLIPGIGDFAGVLLSSSILLSAARLGVPRATLLRMAGNIGLEAVIGTVPVLGDLFDAGWKANVRNVRLIEAHAAEPAGAGRSGARSHVGR